MLIPAYDFNLMLKAQDFTISPEPGDFFVGPTEAVPQVKGGSNRNVPRNAFFVDSGTAFNPTRFMGQQTEIRYARVLLHFRSSDYRSGRMAMMEVTDFLLGKKFYVHPGTLKGFSDRVVWHALGAPDCVDSSDPNNIKTFKRYIDPDDDTLLEYLDVYTTTSDPIHSGPDRNKLHTYSVTYNMVLHTRS